jgi:hypothetical protein
LGDVGNIDVDQQVHGARAWANRNPKPAGSTTTKSRKP